MSKANVKSANIWKRIKKHAQLNFDSGPGTYYVMVPLLWLGRYRHAFGMTEAEFESR